MLNFLMINSVIISCCYYYALFFSSSPFLQRDLSLLQHIIFFFKYFVYVNTKPKALEAITEE